MSAPNGISRIGTLLERLSEGRITDDEVRLLVRKLEQVENDSSLDIGLRIAAVAVLSAIHSRLIHV